MKDFLENLDEKEFAMFAYIVLLTVFGFIYSFDLVETLTDYALSMLVVFGGLIGITYFYLKIDEDEVIKETVQEEIPKGMTNILDSTEQINTNISEDLSEIEIANREENKIFDVDDLSKIKDDKPNPSPKLVAFSKKSLADIDFEEMEKDALNELNSFENSLAN